MSERLFRHRIESVHGVRSVRKARRGPYAGAWVVQVYTLDRTQSCIQISLRFAALGRVSSCNQFPSDDPLARRFQVVLVARDLAGEVAP